jgi:hypothetical protein
MFMIHDRSDLPQLSYRKRNIKGTVSRFISSSPKPPKNNIRVISKFFKKLSRYSTSQGAPPVSTTLEANFATDTAGVVDTGGKFATGVNDTGKNLPPESGGK